MGIQMDFYNTNSNADEMLYFIYLVWVYPILYNEWPSTNYLLFVGQVLIGKEE